VEREPVEVVRAAFEAFNEDGTEAFIEHIHPDVEFNTPADLDATWCWLPGKTAGPAPTG
jgi:ketosteroid isomerase-like protein